MGDSMLRRAIKKYGAPLTVEERKIRKATADRLKRSSQKAHRARNGPATGSESKANGWSTWQSDVAFRRPRKTVEDVRRRWVRESFESNLFGCQCNGLSVPELLDELGGTGHCGAFQPASGRLPELVIATAGPERDGAWHSRLDPP